MWVVRGSGTIQHTHACGMEIHLRPRGEGRYVAMGRSYPCLLYSRHLPSIWGIPYGVFNPRQILKPVDLAVIRFHRPKSVSVRVLFSGFVVIMFRTKKQRKKAEMELVHEVQGLTCQVDCSKAVPITNIGAKVLPGRNIVSSLIEALCENILNREKPLKPRYAEMTKECATNGQQECPTINGWASNKEVLEGGQIFTCKVKMTDPRIQSSHETRGEVVSADLGGCIVDGLEYFWGKSKENIGLESCSVLWRTVNNDAVEVVQNDIYTVLCLGNPTGRFVKAVVIQDYEVRSELSETVRYDHHDDVLQRKSKEYPFCHPIMRGGFLLPQDVRKSGILLKGTE